jgi:lipopolysaccharide/colanic/teichoic acid biosynthesis glycosyltransferase
MPRHRRYDTLKRLIDAVVAAAALVVTLPIAIVVATVVALSMGRPVLFRQVRPGLSGAPFTLVKFRTMHLVDPAKGRVDDGERLTRLGSWLRATSLDELPTLWNVLRAQMSLVGPRPLLVQYLERYSPEQARRHEVRPGVTGLAQVRGRNALAWEERFTLDVWYVDHRSLRLDLKILAETMRAVVRRDGITEPGSPTCHEFRGTATATSETRITSAPSREPRVT